MMDVCAKKYASLGKRVLFNLLCKECNCVYNWTRRGEVTSTWISIGSIGWLWQNFGPMLRIYKSIPSTGKLLLLNSGGFFTWSYIVNKGSFFWFCRYWPKYIGGNGFDHHMQNKVLGACGTMVGKLDSVYYSMFVWMGKSIQWVSWKHMTTSLYLPAKMIHATPGMVAGHDSSTPPLFPTTSSTGIYCVIITTIFTNTLHSRRLGSPIYGQTKYLHS